MKTISALLNINNHGLNQSIITKKLYENYDQGAGDINTNATISQAEYQRDACEEELYRLRYGIENLLANNEQGDFRERQQQRFAQEQNPFRTRTDLNYRKNRSWIDQCSPCFRRWRRKIYDENVYLPNEYAYHHVYNDRNYDLPSHRTPEYPLQSQIYRDSFVSNSPRYIDPDMNHTKNNLRRNINHLINPNTSIETNVSDLLPSKPINDPIYNSLILKILEAKALDCLCTGYSRQNTQKQISQALAEINSRVAEHQWDSVSVTSSRSLPASYESSSSSSSISSILTNDESISSRSITPQLYSPSSSAIQTPNLNQMTSLLVSPENNKDKIESSLKLDEDVKLPKKKAKVTIHEDKTSRSSKAKKQKKPASKHRKRPTKQSKKKPSSEHRKRSTKKSKKKPSSSKSRKKKASSKSPSRSKSNKKQKSKHKKSVKKNRTKPKSNNQVNDHEPLILSTFIYPQSYQEMYRNQQRLFKFLF